MESVIHLLFFGCGLSQDVDNFGLPGQRIRQRRDATGALIQGSECRAAKVALFQKLFGPESDKSQGFGDGVPIKIPLWVRHGSGNILRNGDFPKETSFMTDPSHSTANVNLVAIDIAKEWNVVLVQEACGQK
jgi:hypothetical protein